MSPSLFAIVFSSGVADTVRIGLEAKSAFWFDLVKYSGYAVAVGCAMEAPETFVLIKRWWLFRYRCGETEENKGSWFIPSSAVGLLVIVMGVAAETFFEGKVSDVDALLRAHDSDKITAATTEASNANERASKADLLRLELENRIADIFGPRSLTPKQSARIAEKLRQTGWLGGIKVDVYVYGVNNPYSLADVEDSRSIATTVVKTLRGAKIDAAAWLLQSCWGASASNVVITTSGLGNEASNWSAATELIKAFQPEIGTAPNVEQGIVPAAGCEKVSSLNDAKPNHRKNDAGVAIIVGRKVQPILTREMLEPNP